MSVLKMITKATAPVQAKVVAPIAAKVAPKAPVLLCVAGGLLVVGGTVLACRATLKARDKAHERLVEIEEIKADQEDLVVRGEDGKAEALQAEIRKEWLGLGLDMARSYVLPACLVLSGIACFAIARNIEHKRLLGAIAAMDALQVQFEDYRRNVISEMGAAADTRFMSGDAPAKAAFYEEGEDGKQKKVTKEVVVRDRPADMFTFLFDECNSNEWRKERWQNLDFFETTQSIHYRKKYARGYMLLNEVLEDLGFREFEPWTTQWEWRITKDMDYNELPMYDIVERYSPEELALAKDEHRNPEPSFWIEFKNLRPITEHYAD